jgi:hypothetical protein
MTSVDSITHLELPHTRASTDTIAHKHTHAASSHKVDECQKLTQG